MFAYLVAINVKPDSVDAFKDASIVNAKKSIQEPGIARFDLIQKQDDPSRFMLIEVYTSEEATLKHKETDHYKRWRETVEPMMAEPRQGVRYDIIHPDAPGWGAA
jgi:quinol monooxygenase YgiN